MNRAEKRRQQKLAQKAGKQARKIHPSGTNIDSSRIELLNKAVRLHQGGDLANAEACYRKILGLYPDDPDANHLLGLAAYQRGDSEAALGLITKAIGYRPGSAVFHNNLGLTLHALEQLDAAVASFKKAVDLKPDYVEAHCNLGNVFQDIGDLKHSETAYRKAISVNPDFPGAHYNLGNSLRGQNRFPDAIAAYERAIELKPDYDKAHSNLGDVLKNVGQIERAESCFRKALSIVPESDAYHSNIIFLQDFLPGVDLAAQQEERKSWNKKFIAPLAVTIAPHTNDRDPDRRLRIGYVSADLRGHSASQGLAPLILDHDRNNFDIYCYAGNTATDAMTDRLRAAATGWRAVAGMNDDALAKTIREDAIDILVDLSGHTHGNRLRVFGQKPTPLQVTGIGHLPPGLSTIDYRLTTSVFTRQEEESLFPEKPVYLDTFFAFYPPSDCPSPSPAPFLNGKGLTFGCMNRLSKISPLNISVWATILQRIPDARLLVKYHGLDDSNTRDLFQKSMIQAGVPGERLILLGGTTQKEHLETYGRIDISLDTFPQSGGITTMESLWMGVPVLGLYEPTKLVTRGIKTLCHPLGLDDWIAEDAESLVRLALEWTERSNELLDLRSGLRQRVAEVYSRFTGEVEQAYRAMWRRWCAGEKATALTFARTPAPAP